MNVSRSDAAAGFSATADGYAATMAPSLRVTACEVVRRANLVPGERVLDFGTGTGIGAAEALGQGREVIGLDKAPGMLELARRDVPGVTFVEADFAEIPFADAHFDVVIGVHALPFASDRVAVLHELLRVTKPGGRLSLSVPGPHDTVHPTLYAPIYARHGIQVRSDYPALGALAAWARRAGWINVETDADPTTAIVLADETAFRAWLRVGSRRGTWAAWPAKRVEALAGEMLEITPRDPDGRVRIPFGTLYLRARAGSPFVGVHNS